MISIDQFKPQLETLRIDQPSEKKQVLAKQVELAYYILDEIHVLTDLFLALVYDKALAWRDAPDEKKLSLEYTVDYLYQNGIAAGIFTESMSRDVSVLIDQLSNQYATEGVNGLQANEIESAYSILIEAVGGHSILRHLLSNQDEIEKQARRSLSSLLVTYNQLASTLAYLSGKSLPDRTKVTNAFWERTREFKV